MQEWSHCWGCLNDRRIARWGGLTGLGDDSFDVVYCTTTLAHLDELDRWRYVQEEESLAGPALFPVFGECYDPGNRVNACYRQEH